MPDIDIGLGKTGRRGYTLDEITIVPSRRTRDIDDVDLSWEIDAYTFELPFMAAPSDSVVSPESARTVGGLGGVAVLDLEGLWTRYEDPQPKLDEIAELPDDDRTTARLREIYAEPIKAGLMIERIHDLRTSEVTTAGSLTPARAAHFAADLTRAELDLFVIRGTVVSAEHVSVGSEPLNLKRFVRDVGIPVVVGGCASYHHALHLMRTGAAGVLVGLGSSIGDTTADVLGLGAPMATALADVRSARMRHLDETGVYCQVVASGGIGTSGEIAKAIVCGADAVMLDVPLAAAEDAPGHGWHWGSASHHPRLPRGERLEVGVAGTLEEIVLGPARDAGGTTNLFGALRKSMSLAGYRTVKDFQRADLMLTDGVLAW